MTDSIELIPTTNPINATVRPPGSKSITNRALIVAAIANGTSTLTGVLDSHDTQVMLESLKKLGFTIQHNPENCTLTIQGQNSTIPAKNAQLYLKNSGTSIRFLTALTALGTGEYKLDGNSRMRERPIQHLIEALSQLSVKIKTEKPNGCPPLHVSANKLNGGTTTVAGNISSQYLTALLMVAPAANDNIQIQVEGELVSKPYIKLTLEVMKAFGVSIDATPQNIFKITPQKYQATNYEIEPDASAASYFFALAAITQGTVTVEGLSENSLQGDVLFVNALEKMGCEVKWNENSITVIGHPLKGIDIDMNAISDTAQTLAVVAPFAKGSTRIRNVEHMRFKETDRITAVVNELKKLGINVEEHTDGMTIHPGSIQPASIKTYDDHRMAMSFALIGTKCPGIKIEDPGCTAKTYPQFFNDLKAACAPQ